jgi:hypothetical protein
VYRDTKTPHDIHYSHEGKNYTLTIRLFDPASPSLEYEQLSSEMSRWRSLRPRPGSVNLLPPTTGP